MNAAPATPVSDATLTAFVAICQEAYDARMAKQAPSLVGQDKIGFEKGRVYAKLYVRMGVGRSVYGFVRLSDGALFKALSWKACDTKNSVGSVEKVLAGDTSRLGGYKIY